MTESISENDDDDEHDEGIDGLGNQSIDSNSTRKRKLNTIMGNNKRMHLDRRAMDSDSDSQQNDRLVAGTENDDGDNSMMSHLDDGKLYLEACAHFNSTKLNNEANFF